MTTIDWEEVKRLAADFQKAQLSSTLQKLSERNCIEIVTKLVENKLIDIIYTSDGKEYVTPQHLAKEIKDELYVRGGRVSLVDLAQVLNVSLSQVTKIASDVEKHNKGVKVVLGQLIDKSYTIKVAEEINDKLALQGSINITEITLHYDLPAEFLQSLIEKELGKTIRGKQDTQDPKVFYTDSFISRNRAKIRGALSAITKPTPLSAVLGQCSVPERIFFSILENLQETKQIPGTVAGKGSNSLYVPTIYSKSQNEWVESFYKQNGYLEYDALQRLGISDPPTFVRRHFPNENIVFLDSVAIGTAIIDQVDANIEEAIASGSFVDMYPLLPSVFTEDDMEILFQAIEKRSRNNNTHRFAKTVVISDSFLQDLSKSLEPLAESKAKDAVASGKWLQSVAESRIKAKAFDTTVDMKQSKKDERRKKATSGKAGGGSQGRETKTKSTKKKYLQGKNRDNDSDEELVKPTPGKIDLTLISVDDIKEQLEKDDNLTVVDELTDELALNMQPKLNKYALSVAEQLTQTHKTTNLSEVEERLNVSLMNIKIFDKGIKLLNKTDQAPLTKYLLKSLATDFVNDLFKLAAQQNMLPFPEIVTTETRQKLLIEFPADVREALTDIHKSIGGTSVEDFLNVVDPAMATCCLVLKKYDKKKEKPFILGHKQALIEELNSTHDPALALHLLTSILFITVTQNAIYMSGRHVASILSFLESYLQPTTVSILSKYHDLVLKSLSSSDEESKEVVRKDLETGLTEIKNIVNDFKQHLKADKIQE